MVQSIATKIKAMLDPRTAELLKKHILAGGALGASVGMGTSVINYLSYLKEKADKQKKDPTKDDDILYVNVPRVKAANISAWPGVGGGLAIAGGTLSAVLANALVKKYYNKFKKKQLQQDLDEAQEMYWDVEGKTASALPNSGKPMSTTEVVSSMPVALTLLAAIASGAVTNKALSSYFPSRKSAVDPVKELRPKQVKIRYTDTEENEELRKEASTKEITSAMDFVVASLWQGLDKQASVLPDIIADVSEHGIDRFHENVQELGWAPALDLIKGASEKSIDPDSAYLAICALNRNPQLAPSIASIVEAEVLDGLPCFYKVAGELDYDDQEVLVKVAANLADVVGADVIDRHTDPAKKKDTEEKSEEEEDESLDSEKAYSLLNQALAQGKVKRAPEKKDIVDQVMSGV